MAIDAKECPQILEHLQKSLAMTLHDVGCVSVSWLVVRCQNSTHLLLVLLLLLLGADRWVSGTAKFATVGENARGTGFIQVRC